MVGKSATSWVLSYYNATHSRDSELFVTQVVSRQGMIFQLELVITHNTKNQMALEWN